MKKILLLWYTINQNFGDVLIYDTVKKYLEKYDCKCDYMDVGQPCNKIVKKANEYDFLLFAGGGIIERYVPNVIRYWKEDYGELKIPYGVIGLSIGTFNYDDYFSSISFWIEKASFFYTRDDYSARKLNDIYGKTKVKSGVDVVWANENIKKKTYKNKSYMGINIRNVPYLDVNKDINWKELQNIISHNNISIQIPDESGIIIEGLKQQTYDINNVIDQISKCKMIIAMRYHIILVCAIMGIPCIPISYCNKVHELSQQLNINEYEVQLSQIHLINEKIKSMQSNYDCVKNKILKNATSMKAESLKMLEIISNKIINI